MPEDSSRSWKIIAIIALILASASLAGTFYSFKSNHPPTSTENGSATNAIHMATSPPLKLPSTRELSDALVAVAAKVAPSVVSITTEKKISAPAGAPFDMPFFQFPFNDFFGFGEPPEKNTPRQRRREFRQTGLGSGVVVQKGGYILTNNHVVAEADTISVRTYSNQNLKAKVIGRDPKTDIAVVKVDSSDLVPVAIGDSSSMKVGEFVLAIGNPMSPELAHTVTQGIVSAVGRSNMGLADYEDFIQTDAAINPGNSGGALVNLNSELIGINTAIVSQSGGNQGIGFAVPINMAKQIMASLIETGKVSRGYLGVLVQNLDKDLAEGFHVKEKEGVLLGDVLKGGPADKAGLKRGDVVINLNGQKIESSTQFRNAIASSKPGTEVNLKIIRGGKEQDIKVKLEEAPSSEKIASTSKPSQNEIYNKFKFRVESLTEELREQYQINSDLRGVVVTEIDPSSAAYQAGLREGSLIQAVNQKPVKNLADFVKITSTIKAPTTVVLECNQNGNNFYVGFALE